MRLIALVWLCTPPGGVIRFLAKFLFVTSVFSDNCFLEAPGAFNVVTYTPGGFSILMCSPTVSHVFCGYHICFGQSPVTLGSLTLPYLQQVPGDVLLSEAHLHCFFL